MTTSWCRPDSIWAQVGAKAPDRDLTPAQIRDEILRIREKHPAATIGLTTGFLQEYPAMDFTGLEGVHLWLEKGPELFEIFPLIERAIAKGLRLDCVLQQAPTPEETALLARLPRESLRAICCFRAHLPLPILFNDLKTLFADWRIWTPPAARNAKSFVSGRELFFWRKRHPDLSSRLIFFEGESPRAQASPAYLRDGVSDPLDLKGSGFFERQLVRGLVRGRRNPNGSFFAILLLWAELLALPPRDRLSQGTWRGFRLSLRLFFGGLKDFAAVAVYGWLWRRVLVSEVYWRFWRGRVWKDYGVPLKQKVWHGWVQKTVYWEFYHRHLKGKFRVFVEGVLWRRVLVAGLYWRFWQGQVVGRFGTWFGENVWRPWIVRVFYWKFLYRLERGHLQALFHGVIWKRFIVGVLYWKLFHGVLRRDFKVLVHGILWKRFVVGILYWRFFHGVVRGDFKVLFHGVFWRRFFVGTLYWKWYHHGFCGRVWPALTFPVRKAYWFSSYQYRKRIRPRFFA